MQISGLVESAVKRRAETASLHIAVVCGDPAVGREYRDALQVLGHQACVVECSLQLVELCRAVRPDLIIAEAGSGLDAVAAEVWRERPTPFILVSDSGRFDDGGLTAADSPFFGYVMKPVEPNYLGAAVAAAMNCFERVRELSQEVVQLRQALEDRKIIERAKGMLMRYTGLDEEETFTRLRKTASNQNRKLVEVAQTVVAAGELFRQFEQCGSDSSDNGQFAAHPRRNRPKATTGRDLRAITPS